jgi:hypothetical protein
MAGILEGSALARDTAVPSAGRCWVCGSDASAVVADYRRCRGCGHETLVAGGDSSGIVVNDELDPVRLRRADGLVRAQRRVVLQGARARDLLVDIGCGSGRFLHHCKGLFRRRLGVEPGAASAEFGRRQFDLVIEDALPADLRAVPSVVTFWHSLEHIPAGEIDRLLGHLAVAVDAESGLMVCVPNGASFQARWFGEGYAYYDAPHHLHQFSPASLDMLLRRHGFEPASDAFIANYIAFGYTQSLLNAIVPIRNFLYQKLKRGAPAAGSRRARLTAEILSWAALPFAVAVAAPLTIVDYLMPARRGVIERWYRKRRSSS